ncbi:bile acid:sodium symporter family protein [Rickettsiales bacterium]|nr:bile acid:sodium symporter family protein [Rickettsiales bacterium]
MNFSFPFLISFFLLISFFQPDFLSELKNYVPIFLGLIMFGMGMTIESDDIKRVLINPLWLFVGLFLQFTVMPILAFLLSLSFNLDKELFLGLIVLGSCPGGTASNVIAYLAKANLPLSITMTLISTILSVLLTPIWIFFLADESIQIDVRNLIVSTFWIVVFPLLDGILLRRFFKKKIKKILKIFPKISEIFIALIVGIIFSLNNELFEKISSALLIVIFLHNVLGLFIGYYVSSILKFPDEVKKTIAIEVGMQNSGLGMTLSIIHFNKIVALPSAIFSLWHNLSAIMLILLWSKKVRLND